MADVLCGAAVFTDTATMATKSSHIQNGDPRCRTESRELALEMSQDQPKRSKSYMQPG